jgi:hypothetical protein
VLLFPCRCVLFWEKKGCTDDRGFKQQSAEINRRRSCLFLRFLLIKNELKVMNLSHCIQNLGSRKFLCFGD